MLGFFFYVDACLKGKLNSRSSAMCHQFGWWHPWSSWMAMAFFRPVRTIFCLQQLMSAEGVNVWRQKHGNPMSRKVSQACLGVSRDGVSGRKKNITFWYTKKRTSAQRTIKKRTIPPGEKTIIVFHLKKRTTSQRTKKRTTAPRTPKETDYRSENKKHVPKKSGLPLIKQQKNTLKSHSLNPNNKSKTT